MNTRTAMLASASHHPLVHAISNISVSPAAAGKALSQLEFARHMIMNGEIEPKIAPQLKTAFEQKIREIEDLGVKEFTGVGTGAWVTNLYAKLARDAQALPASQHETVRGEERPASDFKADPAIASAENGKLNGTGGEARAE